MKLPKFNSLLYSFLIFLFFPSCKIAEQNGLLPDAGLFKSKYTKTDIELFNDIAFSNGYIRKWDKDIRVQVIGKAGPNTANIDSLINIIAPLIKPLKIKRVRYNGNLIVYRGVENNRKSHLGHASFKSSPHSKNIQSAEIHEANNAQYLTLMHEFEHALGLNHPRKAYPFDLLIWGDESPAKPQTHYHIEKNTPKSPELGHLYFKTWDEFHRFQAEQKLMKQTQYNEMLPEQEKRVIRMLYSPQIKPGLSRIDFMKAMNIVDDINIWK